MYKKGTYFITGITGLIGGLLVKSLLASEEYGQGTIKIIGLLRDEDKLEKTLRDAQGANFTWMAADCRSRCRIERMLRAEGLDYIIHCAAPTVSSYMVSNPAETADSVVSGTRSMLELARRFSVKSMVYLSSMEVYGKVSDIGRPRREDELGDIPLDSVRSCYPMGKRMAEHYCYIYSQEYGVPVKTARLAQVFGKGVRSGDNRVYMQFARAAAGGQDIILRTQGLSMGNYCASEDAVNAVFTILEKGRDGETYNVVNEANTMRICQMAELVSAKVAKGSTKVKIEPEDAKKTGYAPDTELRLSGEKLRQLGWKPTKGLVEMYEDVINEIR